MTETPTPYRPLRRSTANRMLGGVAAGIAAYANVDPTLVRIGFVVTAIVTGGTAALIYPLLWIIMPEEPADNPGWPTGPAPTA